MQKPLLTAIVAMGCVGAPAHASEVFGGLYAHAVNTPFTIDTGENGGDLQIGARTDPIEAMDFIGKPSGYALGSINTGGDTNFIAAGLTWKIDVGSLYVRPGIGLAMHDAPGRRIDPVTRIRTDLGSRVLFAPEIAVGTSVSSHASLELSWIHISNARLFNYEQNPGIDMMGLRVNVRM